MTVELRGGLEYKASKRNKKDITHVILHHSATNSGNVNIFRDYHKSLGWSDVGYHFIICNGNGGGDGEVQPGRAVEITGAHAPGYNVKSIGICLVGDFSTTWPTETQLVSLYRELRLLMGKYPIMPSHILGHNEVAATACPGHLDIEAIRAEMCRPATDYDHHLHKEAIAKAIQLGLMVGNPDGSFNPDMSCTRAELAAVVMRLYDLHEKFLK